MNPNFGVLHHLQMRLQTDKTQKKGDKKFSVFTAGSIFWPICRVMGTCMINEFSFRCFASFSEIKIRKIGDKKCSVSFLLAA